MPPTFPKLSSVSRATRKIIALIFFLKLRAYAGFLKICFSFHVKLYSFKTNKSVDHFHLFSLFSAFMSPFAIGHTQIPIQQMVWGNHTSEENSSMVNVLYHFWLAIALVNFVWSFFLIPLCTIWRDTRMDYFSNFKLPQIYTNLRLLLFGYILPGGSLPVL